VNDILDRSQTGNEVKELILQLIEQNEEQKNKLNSALEHHQIIVRKLHWDIAKLQQRSSRKFKISLPNTLGSDRRMVKRFTPTGKSNIQKLNSSRKISASAALLPELSQSEEEIQMAYMTRTIDEAEAALSAHRMQRSEYTAISDGLIGLPYEQSESLQAAMTRSLKEQSASVQAALTAHINYRCYANVSDDLKDPVDTSDLDSSGESEPPSHYDDYKDSVTDTSDLDASAESDFPSPLKSSRNDKPQGHKWNSYRDSKPIRTPQPARQEKDCNTLCGLLGFQRK
jgi:hypothetical protein